MTPPQSNFLRHEFLSSLSVAQLGKQQVWEKSVIARMFKGVVDLAYRLLPNFLTRRRTVLGIQTALALLQREDGAGTRSAYVHMLVPLPGRRRCVAPCLLNAHPHLCACGGVGVYAGATSTRTCRRRKRTVGGQSGQWSVACHCPLSPCGVPACASGSTGSSPAPPRC